MGPEAIQQNSRCGSPEGPRIADCVSRTKSCAGYGASLCAAVCAPSLAAGGAALHLRSHFGRWRIADSWTGEPEAFVPALTHASAWLEYFRSLFSQLAAQLSSEL